MESELTPVRCGCGGEAEVHVIGDETGTLGVYVVCEKCLTQTEVKRTEVEAVEAWNIAMGERTAKVKNIAHIRGYPMEGNCGNCDYDVYDDGEYCPGCGAKLDWSDYHE